MRAVRVVPVKMETAKINGADLIGEAIRHVKQPKG
jgi:hypothetical protein